MTTSSIRRFSELFIPSCGKGLSIYTRLSIPLAILVMAAVSTSMGERGVLFTAYGYLVVIFVLLFCKALLKSIKGLLLPFVFIALGFAVHLLTMLMGYPTPTIYSLILSSFKIALVFISITVLLQWVSFKEARCILIGMGLKSVASYLSVAFAVMPMLFYLYSESYVAAMLKLGKRRAYKAVKPLVVQAAVLAKDVAQALYLYGAPTSCRSPLKRPAALEVLLVVATILAGAYILVFMP